MHFLFFLLPMVASAGYLERPLLKRQAGAPVAKIENKEPQFRKQAKRTVTKFGPYTIRGSSGNAAKGGKGPGGTGMGDSTLAGQSFFLNIQKVFAMILPKGLVLCSLVKSELCGQMGERQPQRMTKGIYIHHILSSDKTKKETNWISNCGSPTSRPQNIAALTGGAAFLGTGEDGSAEMAIYNNVNGTAVDGYHIGAQDQFTAWAQLVNYNPQPASVYVFYDMEWIPGLQGDNVKTVTLSATCGGGMIKMSQSGPTNTTSGKFYIQEDGRILGGRGHLHDGGVAMDVFINDKLACISTAKYGDKSQEMGHSHSGDSDMGGITAPATGGSNIKTISYMTDCSGPFPVEKGDYVTLRAEYDLSKHPLRKSASGADAGGVMGMMGIVFAQGR